MKDPTLTVLVPTGRSSFGSLIGLPDEHLFLRTMRSLEAQACRDFELVIADACHKYRNLTAELCALGGWTFPWRVVPVESPWLALGRAAIQRTLNVGFTHADGRYVHMAGDACEFPPHIVGEIIKWCRQGYQPQLLSVYKRGGEVLAINEQTKDVVFGHGHQLLTLGEMQAKGIFKDIARDSRWDAVERASPQPFFNAPESWLHNHPTVGLREVFKINGFDENFDGQKSLQDVEMGDRLAMAGLWKPVLTEELYCIDHDHGSWDTKTFFKENIPGPRSNHQLIVFNHEYKRCRANAIKLAAEEYAWVLKSGATAIEDRCPVYKKDEQPESHFLQNIGFALQPIFDLQAMWTARRVSEGKSCAF